MRCGQAVWRAWIVEFLGAFDELGRFLRRVLDGYDLIVFTMEHQRRDVELLEVLGEVGLREGLDAFVSPLDPGLHAPKPELVEDALGDLRTGTVRAVEGDGKLLVVLRAIA